MEETNIKDLLTLLMGRVKLGEQDTRDFVEAMFGIIRDALARDRMVKVKGLGTFKVVDIDPRESVNVNTGERMLIEGHWKVAFTPDAMMKELVNKPFSQFETVVLNDGVVFGDEDAEGRAEAAGEPVQEAPAPAGPVQETPAPAGPEEEEPALAEAPIEPAAASPLSPEPPAAPVETYEVESPALDLEAAPGSPEPLEEAPLEAPGEDGPEAGEEASGAEDTPGEAEAEAPGEEDEPSAGRRWKVALLHVVGCVLLAGVSLWAGYQLGLNASVTRCPGERPVSTAAQAPARPAAPKEPAAVKPAAADTIPTADTLRADTLRQPAPKEAPAPDYAAMDVRVRTGAYRIVGLNRTVKAREGEHVRNISDRTLGPGMECYIEVFNGFKGNAALRAGQEVKIPELKIKKRSSK